MNEFPRAIAMAIRSHSKHYQDCWKASGEAQPQAPDTVYCSTEPAHDLSSEFLDKKDCLAFQIEKLIGRLDGSRTREGAANTRSGAPISDQGYSGADLVDISRLMNDDVMLFDDVMKLFDGTPTMGNPSSICHVMPQSHSVAMIVQMLSQFFLANVPQVDHVWNAYPAALRSADMISNLVGWNSVRPDAIYMYGGGDCWTFGIEYGPTPKSPADSKAACPQYAGYVAQNIAKWMEHLDTVCVSHDLASLITLFRIPPKRLASEDAGEKELNKHKLRRNILKDCLPTDVIASKMLEWIRDDESSERSSRPYRSFSAGLGTAIHAVDRVCADDPIYVLKSFPMDVFVSPGMLQWTLPCAYFAREGLI